MRRHWNLKTLKPSPRKYTNHHIQEGKHHAKTRASRLSNLHLGKRPIRTAVYFGKEFAMQRHLSVETLKPSPQKNANPKMNKQCGDTQTSKLSNLHFKKRSDSRFSDWLESQYSHNERSSKRLGIQCLHDRRISKWLAIQYSHAHKS